MKELRHTTLSIIVLMIFIFPNFSTSTYFSNHALTLNQLPPQTQTEASSINYDVFSQVGGMVSEVDVEGGYAYVAVGDRLEILDISNPATPVRVGRSITLRAHVYEIVARHPYVYIATSYGLVVFNVSNPARPFDVVLLKTGKDVNDFLLLNNIGYICVNGGIEIWNFSNPNIPVKISTIANEPATKLAGDGHYLHILSGGKYKIYDISNVQQPVLKGSLDIVSYSFDLAVLGTTVYIAVGLDGLKIVSVDNVMAPSIVKSLPVSVGVLEISTPKLFLYDGSNLNVYSLSNPRDPQLTGSIYINSSTSVYALNWESNQLYLSAGFNGLNIYNTSQPGNIHWLGSYAPILPRGEMAVYQNFLYVPTITGLMIYDVSQADTPQFVGSITNRGEVTSVKIVNSKAYVTFISRVFSIYDLQNPASPVENGIISIDPYPIKVDIVGNRAYILIRPGGFDIVDISNPILPTRLGRYRGAQFAMDLAANGSLVYLVDLNQGFRVIDASNPSGIIEQGFVSLSGQSYAVALNGNYAYVVPGFTVIDIHSPSNPQLVATFPIGGAAIYVSGNFAYTNSNGVTIIDITDPANPSFLSESRFAQYSDNIIASSDHVYLSSIDAGLVIFGRTNGFWPLPDGYSFSNANPDWNCIGCASSDFRPSDMVSMYGPSICRQIVNGTCYLTNAAIARYSQIVGGMEGRCFGMVASSQRFFNQIEPRSVGEFQAGAHTVFDLNMGTMRRHISYVYALQNVPSIHRAILNSLTKDYSNLITTIKNATMSESSSGVILILRSFDPLGSSVHALIPYAVEMGENGDALVRVYDPNYPEDRFRTLILSTSGWSYNLGSNIGVWTSNPLFTSIGALPINVIPRGIYNGTLPWNSLIDSIEKVTVVGSGELYTTGNGHLLLTDSAGRRLGFTGNEYIEEIPGAGSLSNIDGLGIYSEPTYSIPITDTYTVQLTGAIYTDTIPSSLTFMSPNRVMALSGILVGPSTNDVMVIDPAQESLQYTSTHQTYGNFTLIADQGTLSYQIDAEHLDFQSNQTLTLSLNTDATKFVLDQAQDSSSTYDLKIIRDLASDRRIFIHTAVPLDANTTYYVRFAEWNGSGPIYIDVDQGRDGHVDFQMSLENYPYQLFLPTINR